MGCPYGYEMTEISEKFPLENCKKCEHETFSNGVCSCKVLENYIKEELK